MPTREELLADAEAECTRLSDKIDELDEMLSFAQERLDGVEDADWGDDEGGEMSRRHADLEESVEHLKQQISEVSDELIRATGTLDGYQS